MIVNLKQRMASGSGVYGIWSLITHGSVTEILASSGMGFVILDNEHGGFSYSELEGATRACATYGTAAVVRVSRPDPVEIQKVLDVGVDGILVPQVRSRQDVELVVSSCRLAPEGRRGFNPFTRAGYYRGDASSRFFDPQDLTVGVLIENYEALSNLETILSVPGLDLVYVGVYDLSCSLGVPGLTNHAVILDALDRILVQALAYGVQVGLMVGSKSDAEPFLSRGFRFFVFKPDTAVLAESMRRLLE